MKPVKQTKFGGSCAPEEERGDCTAACLASIFEVRLDEAPYLAVHLAEGTWADAIQGWLKPRGLWMLPLIPESKGYLRGWGMAAVTSANLRPPDGHMVVTLNGIVDHDPGRTKQESYEVLEYWAFIALNPQQAREDT